MTEPVKPPERLKLEVTLTITHSVTVYLETTSDKTIDEMRHHALAEFAKVGQTTWRNQFRNHDRIGVGDQRVTIGAINTRTAPTPRLGDDY